ncbi:unnamed protein product [Mycena citricolor]|uniref:MULE transposase domain-containing protein n=1 Tax=Mycena citricolor TaxID=2018698 RepID=A0AAD2HJC2_9AGAR|nr:unnamed protein product [Mycena citricolor]
MELFECHGTINVWASEDTTQFFVRYQHKDSHKPYVNIDLPPAVRRLIENRADMCGPQIWKEILKTYPEPLFSYHQVYNHLLKLNSGAWRLDENEEKSAELLLEKLCSERPECAMLERIRLPNDPVDGYSAFAFSLPALIRKWGGCVKEVQLDSTFKTNKIGYECFAILGEVFGSGVSLGFLLIKSNGNPKLGAKEAYIQVLLRNITEHWEISPIQTLSDKDITEINAFLAVFPKEVKHQLCLWHGIQAFRGRLSVISRPPALYHADEAFAEFDFIDVMFLPVAQMQPEDRATILVAHEMIPTIQFRLGGALLPRVPERSKIVIQVDGNVRNVLGSLDNPKDLLNILDDEEEFAEHLLAGEESDRLEAADSWLEPDEEPIGTIFRTVDGSDVFCPAVHRKQLVHMFIRHWCLHSLLLDQSGQTQTKDEIRREAVHEAYRFCYQRGLREVWAYMWEAWYCPSKWRLWARSSQPDYIGRWRTTMAVENFWRNIKKGALLHLTHPRLDQLVYLIANEILPSITAKMSKFDPKWRDGRTVKAAYSAVYPPDPQFFRNVYRRRVIPFYHHPEFLMPKSGPEIRHNTFKASDLAGDFQADGIDRARSAASTQVLDVTAAPHEDQEEGNQYDAELFPSSPARSQPSVHPNEEYDDKDELEEFGKNLLNVLEGGITLLKRQLENIDESQVLLRALKRRKIGQDLAAIVADNRHATETGQIRRTVWGLNGSRADKRYSRNTMGAR